MAFFFVSNPKPFMVRCFSAAFVFCGPAPSFFSGSGAVLFQFPWSHLASLYSGAAVTSPKKLLRRGLTYRKEYGLMLWKKIPYPIFLENC
ncbi:hypothetical protein CEXT_501541 [Caerostris extrusa]|uniref:Secreted protein n=1 Tax=Caerostris extrusa TaxID=172846 RepID=A0AAV4R2M0_CAEEX|nr:hypothetical protein CEXT_501541 [Caerostris extrusa]